MIYLWIKNIKLNPRDNMINLKHLDNYTQDIKRFKKKHYKKEHKKSHIKLNNTFKSKNTSPQFQ